MIIVMIYCIKKPEDEEYYNIKKGGIIVGYRDTYFNRNDAYDNNNGWYTCKKCGRKFRKGDMDIDHIIPQKFGGQDSEWNLQCRRVCGIHRQTYLHRQKEQQSGKLVKEK